MKGHEIYSQIKSLVTKYYDIKEIYDKPLHRAIKAWQKISPETYELDKQLEHQILIGELTITDIVGWKFQGDNIFSIICKLNLPSFVDALTSKYLQYPDKRLGRLFNTLGSYGRNPFHFIKSQTDRSIVSNFSFFCTVQDVTSYLTQKCNKGFDSLQYTLNTDNVAVAEWIIKKRGLHGDSLQNELMAPLPGRTYNAFHHAATDGHKEMAKWIFDHLQDIAFLSEVPGGFNALDLLICKVNDINSTEHSPYPEEENLNKTLFYLLSLGVKYYGIYPNHTTSLKLSISKEVLITRIMEADRTLQDVDIKDYLRYFTIYTPQGVHAAGDMEYGLFSGVKRMGDSGKYHSYSEQHKKRRFSECGQTRALLF